MAANRSDGRVQGLKKSPWNLVLLVPLLMLVTPLYNSVEPRLFGLPFFYWAQFVWVILGVLSVGIVYLKTRDIPTRKVARSELKIEELDEGEGEK